MKYNCIEFKMVNLCEVVQKDFGKRWCDDVKVIE